MYDVGCRKDLRLLVYLTAVYTSSPLEGEEKDEGEFVIASSLIVLAKEAISSYPYVVLNFFQNLAVCCFLYLQITQLLFYISSSTKCFLLQPRGFNLQRSVQLQHEVHFITAACPPKPWRRWKRIITAIAFYYRR
jgi:hypothetical protein